MEARECLADKADRQYSRAGREYMAGRADNTAPDVA